jgi:hypothetical protein
MTQNKTVEETSLRIKTKSNYIRDENRIIPTEGEGIGLRWCKCIKEPYVGLKPLKGSLMKD